MHYLLAAILFLFQLPAPPPAPDVDPAIRAVVERFFETQQAEDAAAYLSLWSSQAKTLPRPDQLKFIFDSGDDLFSDITIVRATVSSGTARVLVSVTRVRTDATMKRPDGKPRVFTTKLQLALSLVREGDTWKILREGAPSDELAHTLIQTTDPQERQRILESEPELLNVRLVEAISRQADNFAQQSQYKPAQAIYERALEVAERIGDRKAQGQAMQNIANSLYFQRDFAGALVLYERRLQMDREADNKEGMASALLGIATIRYASHEYGTALQAYREALAIQETLGDNVMIATTLISTGNVLYLQGDYEAAIADYRRAEALKRKYLDLTGAAMALEGLGRVYTSQGDYAAALAAFTGVLEEHRTRNDVPRQARALQSIGEIHFRLGNTDQARATYDESRRQFEAAKDIGNAGRVLQGTALNELVAGRFAAGEKAYVESIAKCTTADDPECIARAQVGLAFALAAQQKYDEAIGWYSKSILSFIELKMTDAEARARIGSADALLGRGDAAESMAEAEKARHTAIALESDDLLWRALVAEARAARKLARPADAMGAAKAAVLAVRRMSAAALDRPGHAVPQDTTAAFKTLVLLHAEAGDSRSAFDTAEEMRAHALRSWLAPHEREIARGMTEAEREAERTHAIELSTLIVRRDRQKDLPKPDAEAIKKLDAAITEAVTRRREAQEALFNRLPELRVWRGLGSAPTADEAASLLDQPGRLLLQFVVDDRDVVVIVAKATPTSLPDDAEPTKQGLTQALPPSVVLAAEVLPIERQDLAERIGRAMDGKVLADEVAWRKASVPVWEVLPPAVLKDLTSATSVIVIPDDVLWRVPFEAMPIDRRYLADSVAVSYATSVGAMVSPPPGPTPAANAPVLVVHSPELPKTVVETLATTAPTWMLRAPEAAAKESAAIGGNGEEPAPVVLAGTEANKAGFAAAPIGVASAIPRNSRFSALHVAAPFRVNSASPLFSPVLLAAATFNKDASADRAEAPELTARDLFALAPTAPLVMLSDPAALSRRDGAASLAPIAWAWRSTGASSLILRRWGGNDTAASTVMARYYEALRAGTCPSDAFRAARSSLRASPGGGAPAAWAGWLELWSGSQFCR